MKLVMVRTAYTLVGGVALVLVLFVLAPVMALLEPRKTARFFEDVGEEVVNTVRER